jgi:signal transduction histidine kinase
VAAATPSRVSGSAGGLRRRSFRDVAWLAGLTWALLTAALLLLVRIESARISDESLRERAEVVLAFSQHELEEMATEGRTGVRDEIEDSQRGTLIYQVWFADGRLAFRSSRAPAQPLLAEPGGGFRDVEIDGRRMRALGLWNASRTFQAQLAEVPEARGRYALAGSLLVGLAMAGTFALFLLRLDRRLRQAFASLDETADELAATPASRLAMLSTEGKPEELLPVIAAFNGMATRVQRALQYEQRFTADAAHELKTPLAALKILLRNAERASDGAERIDALHQMEEVVDRSSALVDQLLALARYDRDPSAFDMAQPVDMASVCRATLQDLQPLARQRGIAVQLELPPEPPPLHGNREALSVLLRNLLDNALRHAPAQGRVELVLLRDDDGRRLQVEVHDSGPGIPPALRTRVFSRFVRATGQDVPGTGLGLAIVERIAHLHGGEVELQASSRLGGTVAVVRLPVVRPNVEAG